MRQYRRATRFERWMQEARDYVRALCEALVLNPLFFVALMANCVALLVLWFVGLQ